MPGSARRPELKGKGIKRKGAGSGALYLASSAARGGAGRFGAGPVCGTGSAVAPGGGIAAAAVMGGQRQPRLEAFEFDAGAAPGPQQPVGGFAQRRTVLLRVLYQRSIERGKKRRNIGIDAVAQLLIDKSGGAFLVASDGAGPGFARVLAQHRIGTRPGLGKLGRRRPPCGRGRRAGGVRRRVSLVIVSLGGPALIGDGPCRGRE